jgi:outer membrane protein assembly factor BamA
MALTFLRIRTLLLLLLATFSAAAQTYKPAKVLFPNIPADQSAALLNLSGLTPGHPITKPDIEKAVQVLGDTGLFVDLRYAVDDRALTFTLTPTPPAEMLPVVFANFLFWKPGELEPLLRARVPLFTGTIPVSGTLQQSIADALTALLLERGIKARIEAILSQDRGQKAVAFSIISPAVQIRQVNVTGVSEATNSKIVGMLHNFSDSPFDRHSPDAVRQRLLDTYLDLGYLDIAIDPPTPTEPVVEPTRIFVDVITTVHENAQYLISRLEWPVSPIVPKGEFERSVLLKPGEPASRIELLSAAARGQAAFALRGYLDAKLTRIDQKDSTDHTIAYTFTAAPGELYHVKAIHTVGFTQQQQKDFDRNWKLLPGSEYDGVYASLFFSRNNNVVSFQGTKPELDLKQDHADHTVELVISLTPRGTPRQN